MWWPPSPPGRTTSGPSPRPARSPRSGPAPPPAPGGYGYGVAPGPPTGTFPVVPRQRAPAQQAGRGPGPAEAAGPDLAQGHHLAGRRAGAGRGRRVRHPASSSPQWLARRTSCGWSTPVGAHRRRLRPATTTQAHQAAVVVPAGSTGPGCQLHRQHRELRRGRSPPPGPVGCRSPARSSSVPLLVGVQPAGKHLSFPAKGTMTVQVGSSAVVVGVTVKGKSGVLQRPTPPPTPTPSPPPASTPDPDIDAPVSSTTTARSGAVSPGWPRLFGIELGVVARPLALLDPDPLDEHRDQGQEGEQLRPDPEDRRPRRGCWPPCTWTPPGGWCSAGPGPGTTRWAPRPAG